MCRPNHALLAQEITFALQSTNTQAFLHNAEETWKETIFTFRKDGHSVSKPYMYFKSQIMVITDERQRVRGSGVCLISASKASPSVNLMASGGMVAPCVIGINGDLAYTFSYMVRWWFAYDLHIIYEVRYFYIMR